MTEEQRKKAIKEALLVFRDDIEKARDYCAEEITPHLNALGVDLSDDYEVYKAIETHAKINAETFFSIVGFDMSNLCEYVAFCER